MLKLAGEAAIISCTHTHFACTCIHAHKKVLTQPLRGTPPVASLDTLSSALNTKHTQGHTGIEIKMQQYNLLSLWLLD